MTESTRKNCQSKGKTQGQNDPEFDSGKQARVTPEKLHLDRCLDNLPRQIDGSGQASKRLSSMWPTVPHRIAARKFHLSEHFKHWNTQLSIIVKTAKTTVLKLLVINCYQWIQLDALIPLQNIKQRNMKYRNVSLWYCQTEHFISICVHLK